MPLEVLTYQASIVDNRAALAAAGSAEHRQEWRVTGLLNAIAGQTVAAKEVIGVGLLEGSQTKL
jgi:hypothetical protein